MRRGERSTGLRIMHLLEVPGAASLLARWFIEEWAPWYGPDGPGDAHCDLAACCSRDSLPICLVALDSGATVLGTAALRPASVGDEIAEGPWLAGLLVGNRHRKSGVAAALEEAIVCEARRLGFHSIFTSTDNAARTMERRGWRAIGSADSLRGTVVVYRRNV